MPADWKTVDLRGPSRIYSIPVCTLRVNGGSDAGLSIAVGADPLRIGTSSDCEFRLTDRSVSRHHATIRWTPEGHVLEDGGSTNGSRVNGVRVKQAVLDPAGCQLSMGGSTLEFSVQERKVVAQPSTDESLGGLVGGSRAMRSLYGLLKQVAPTDATVVIHGESGTGKEETARVLHGLSLRARGPFVVFDCANINRDLMGSELFGHRRGAFTGAVTDYKGAFERADGGTLFLDEIGEFPPELQARLLGALQRRQIQVIGSETPRSVNVRVVTATHRDLPEMCRLGTFREDLFFRLSVITVFMPPLREHLEDLPALVDHLLKQFAHQATEVPKVTSEALEVLRGRAWKGNVRELANVIQRAVLLASGGWVGPEHFQGSGELPAWGPSGPAGAEPPVRGVVPTATISADSLENAERAVIQAALLENGGQKKPTARQLGIAVSTLRAKLKKYGLEPSRSETPTD